MSDAIIRTTDLTKRFGEFVAVDQLTITVPRGAIFAFLGANGSGKSTTIRMLIGLLTPTGGTIDVDGIDVIATPRRVRDRIGYMGQKVSLYQGLTLRENVEFYAGLFGLEGDVLERRWGALRERFELTEAERERPADLPAGVRQRAGLALSTLHEPRLLFLDEPTAGVDVRSRGLFWEFIQEEAALGVTVFVTTHFLEEVDYCDWVSFIDRGKLIVDAAPETLRQRYSDGYVIDVALPRSARDAVARAVAAQATVTPTADGLHLRAPALDAALGAALADVVARHPDAQIHVRQPEMPDVFRRILGSAA